MKTPGKRWHSILKALHLFFVSIWVGSWLCLLLLLVAGLNIMGLGQSLEIFHKHFVPASSLGSVSIGQILAIASLVHTVITIPSVIGSMVTGILFSATTNWGFFKHGWIILKYVFNIFPIAGGVAIFMPQLRDMMDIAWNDPSGAVTNPVFIQQGNGAVIFLAAQFVMLGVATYLSVFKPKIGPRRRLAASSTAS